MPTPILATYRVQLNAEFGFAAAAGLAEYLAALGVTHLYSSPSLQAAPGSTHGYDVVDPQRVSAALGGADGHARMCAALRAQGLGLVLDVVPNHMAIASPDNAWWWDVLENGPSSRYARHFDVDWDPPETKLRNLVLVPILADHYGRVLEGGGLRVDRAADRFVVRYAEHVLPLAPRTLDDLLAVAAARCGAQDLAAIADGFARLPLATATDPASMAERHRGKEWLGTELARLIAEQPAVGAAIDAEIADLNADLERLHALLERQNYRLAFWRTAARELGYRRFFDINTLVGLRVEDEAVFADTHALVLRWLADGTLDGVRIDHPDGLRDPERYLQRLRAAAPQTWIVVEKILAPDEALRARWPVDGTTGYDFLQRVGGLFIDPAAAAPLTALYGEFTGEPTDYGAVAHEQKHQIMRGTLAADVNRLTALLVDVCEHDRRHRDYTRHELHEAVRELIAALPVYRTYVRLGGAADADDVRIVAAAAERAQRRRSDLDPALFEFLRDLVLLRVPGDIAAEFAMRFQQLSGPVMAKGVEDTAFYCFNRFAALNEVGGDPSRFGVEVEAFHRASLTAQADWPRSMLATATHDTKRGEDVRARLALLTEMPARWEAGVRRWASLNDHRHRDGLPDRNAEYLFYQTLVGAWPLEPERAVAYMEKAAREAKQHTSWTNPDARYEAALRDFVTGALADPAFTAAIDAFVAPLIAPWQITSLAQVLIKLSAPGIPDLYQGSELWDLNLVDPDNRRPVDFGLRRRLLAELDDLTPEAIWERAGEGLPKLWVIRQALAMRRAHPQWFGESGDYRPVEALGARARHVVAFARGDGAITVVPRLVIGLGGDWSDTHLELPSGWWRNCLTGEPIAGGTLRLSDLLRRFPVALLTRG
jgi:(1->4)-alpha-D-glucan 1-alpha-D-glucosylmutase